MTVQAVINVIYESWKELDEEQMNALVSIIKQPHFELNAFKDLRFLNFEEDVELRDLNEQERQILKKWIFEIFAAYQVSTRNANNIGQLRTILAGIDFPQNLANQLMSEQEFNNLVLQAENRAQVNP